MSKDALAAGNFFAQHPEKILGQPYESTSRFGKAVTKYKGTLSDVQKIDVPLNFMPSDTALVDTKTSDIEVPIAELVTSASANENLDKAIQVASSEIVKKAKKKTSKKSAYLEPEGGELLTFDEVFKMYNPEISVEELNAYAYWKSQSGQPLRGEWLKSGLIQEPTPEKIKQWVSNQILCYYKAELLPAFIYLSENVYERKSVLQREMDDIIALYGQAVYDAQAAKLEEVFLKKYNERLRLDIPNDPNHPDFHLRLTLLPTSDIARSFVIKHLLDELPFKMKKVTASSAKNYNKPDFIGAAQGKGRARDEQEFEELSLLDAFQLWLVKNTDIRYTKRSNAEEIISIYINHRPRPKDVEKEDWKRIQARAKENGDRLFMEFLANALAENDRIRLERIWNEQYNSYQKINYDKVPVAFRVGKYLQGEPFEMRWEKREAVAFMTNEGSGSIAFGVGYGKTFSAIWSILQAMDAGFCKRPMVVVPNQTYKQWISEIKSTAPHIHINDLYNLSQDYINEVIGANGIRAVKENSITLLTYEGFEQIGFGESTANKLISTLYDILNQGGASEMHGKGKGEREKATFEQRLETLLGKAQKGTMVNIEDLGIDYMAVDEAHSMKKVFTTVKNRNKSDKSEDGGSRDHRKYSIQSGTPSSLALKGFMIAHYISDMNNGRNVCLLTATPFTNSPLEIFSMLALIAYKKLEESAINNLEAFFDNYIETSDELVINNKLKPVRKEIVKGFRNLPALQQLIYRFINYKDADMADAKGRTVKLVRPNKITLPYRYTKIDGVSVELPAEEQVSSVIPLTPLQENLMNDIIKYAEGNKKYDEICGVEQFGSVEGDIEEENRDTTEAEELNETNLDEEETAGVVALRAMNFARNLALSPYLYKCSGMTKPTYKQYIDTSSKLSYVMGCVKSVKQYHEDKGEPISGQIIYMDRGVDYFNLIKRYLVEEIGYKEHEIGIIVSGMPKEGVKSKSHIQNLFLGRIFDNATKTFKDIPDDQRVKVVIGSSTIKEGLNLQKYTTVIYNCFLDWNPTDYVQLCGRGWRQGNMFENIRIVNPLCENSMDIFIFQKLGEKTDRINQIWNLNGKTNVLNLEEFNPKELKFALVRDPMVLAELESQDEATRLQDSIAENEAEIKTVKQIESDDYLVTDQRQKLIEEAKSVRPSKVKSDSSTDSLIALIMDAIKTQKDENGQEFKQRYNGTNKFDFSWWNKRNDFDEYKAAWRRLKRDTDKVLKPKKVKLKDISAYVEYLEKENKRLEEQIAQVSSKETIQARAEEIAREREAKQIKTQPIKQRIKEFEKLNWMLSVKRAIKPTEQKALPVPASSCPPVDAAGNRRIDDEAIRMLDNCIENLPETKELYTVAPDVYSDERRELHQRIIGQFLDGKPCIINGEPIAILTGGTPASGKSSYLKKNFAWMLSGKAFHIDADEVRSKLPEYKGWNAAVTHRETSDIVREMLDAVGSPCKYDVIFDGTMNKTKNYIPLINQVKGLGYKTFIVYVKVPSYEIAITRAMKRYQKSGRYVPKFVIDEAWQNGLTAFEELKEMVDGWQLVDGVTGEVLDKGGLPIPNERNYEVLATQEVESENPPPSVKPIESGADEDELLRLKAKAQKQKILILQMKLKKGKKLEDGGDIDNIKKVINSFAKDSLGILRKDMPQIIEQYRDDYKNYMISNGVEFVDRSMDPNKLKAIQADFHPEIIQSLLKSYKGSHKPVFITADNYVIDGHHTVIVSRIKGGRVKVIQMSCDAKKCMELTNEYPHVEFRRDTPSKEFHANKNTIRLAN